LYHTKGQPLSRHSDRQRRQSHALREPGFVPHMHMQLHATPAGTGAGGSNGLTGDVACFQECPGGHPQLASEHNNWKMGKTI